MQIQKSSKSTIADISSLQTSLIKRCSYMSIEEYAQSVISKYQSFKKQLLVALTSFDPLDILELQIFEKFECQLQSLYPIAPINPFDILQSPLNYKWQIKEELFEKEFSKIILKGNQSISTLRYKSRSLDKENIRQRMENNAAEQRKIETVLFSNMVRGLSNKLAKNIMKEKQQPNHQLSKRNIFELDKAKQQSKHNHQLQYLLRQKQLLKKNEVLRQEIEELKLNLQNNKALSIIPENLPVSNSKNPFSKSRMEELRLKVEHSKKTTQLMRKVESLELAQFV